MTRLNVLELNNVVLQRAVFTAFDPDQKLEFWKQKLNEVLVLNWNTDEKKHIQQMKIFIDENKNIFDRHGMTDAELIFIYKWIENAKQWFNWTDMQIFGIIMEGNKLLDTSGNIEMNHNNTTVRLRSGGESSCDCHRNNIVLTTCGTYPNPTHRCVMPKNCDMRPDGCGAFWQESCDGECDPNWWV